MVNKFSLTIITLLFFTITPCIYSQQTATNNTENATTATNQIEVEPHQVETTNYSEYGKILIAILNFNFENVMPIYAELFSDFVRSEFSKQGANLYAVIDKEMVANATKNTSLENFDITTPEYAVKIGELAGAKGIITGTISFFSNKYYTKGILVDSATGEIIRSETLEFNDFAQLHQAAKELVARLLGNELEIRSTAILEPLKTYKNKNIAIGIGNPYISLYYDMSSKLSIEPRIAGDFADIRLYVARLYYKMGGKRFLWYLAFEPGFIEFKATTGRKNGYMIGFYPGVEYLINDSFSFNVDIGPSYIDLDSKKAAGFEWILNTGIRFYP